jgi:hypothetical protein
LGGVFAQRFAADGSKAGAEFQVNTFTTSDQWAPAVASLANGGFVITWASHDQDGDQEESLPNAMLPTAACWAKNSKSTRIL